MFVTEAYNESILLQDNTKMFHFLDLWNSTVSLLFAQRERERDHQIMQQKIRERERDHQIMQQKIRDGIFMGNVIQPSS